MKKQVVFFSEIFLVLLFVLGGYFYKNQQTKKLGFLARERSPAVGGTCAAGHS